MSSPAELELPRIAGVLVPAPAIRTSHSLGIGDTDGVKRLIDWAVDCGFKVLKLLPINETGGDHSPYNAISSCALEPSLLDVSPQAIPDLSTAEFDALTGNLSRDAWDGDEIDYPATKQLKRSILFKAFENFIPSSCELSARQEEFEAFQNAQSAWLVPYTLFRALMEEHGSEVWPHWPEAVRSFAKASDWLDSVSMEERNALEHRRLFLAYVQWQGFAQWHGVRQHAEERGIELMGDIPFGVSYYSADVWAHPHLFKTGWSGGTPPDTMFTHDRFVQEWGQNWGIPLYEWLAMAADDFKWWKQRVASARELFHLFRIDHILGFYRIYGFPWRPEENESFLDLTPDQARERREGREPGFHPRPDDTAENQSQNCSEGEGYLKIILEAAGENCRVVGEDLGFVPDYVRPSISKLGIAGYKVPQWERSDNGKWIPYSEYPRLSLATYATHDHEPIRVYWDHLLDDAKHSEASPIDNLAEFLSLEPPYPQEFTDQLHEAFLRALFRSNSWLAVLMITDVFGGTTRFNQPGVSGSQNWTRRLDGTVDDLAASPKTALVRRLLEETGRV